MEEIYWITRLDGINVLLNVMTVLGIVFTVISIGGYIITKNDDHVDDCWKKFWIKLFKYCFPTTIIITLLFIFTPTTKEALMIWGVGGTIDYVKSNDTAKQLPDKCIEALDKWVDSLNEQENNRK
jgi:hypothetical protein